MKRTQDPRHGPLVHLFSLANITPPAHAAGCIVRVGPRRRRRLRLLSHHKPSGFTHISIGAFLLFNSTLNYLSDAYPEYAASVLAGNDLFRSMVGAGFPLFARQPYDKLGVPGTSSLLGGLSVLFIPIPFLLFAYGSRIRIARTIAIALWRSMDMHGGRFYPLCCQLLFYKTE